MSILISRAGWLTCYLTESMGRGRGETITNRFFTECGSNGRITFTFLGAHTVNTKHVKGPCHKFAGQASFSLQMIFSFQVGAVWFGMRTLLMKPLQCSGWEMFKEGERRDKKAPSDSKTTSSCIKTGCLNWCTFSAA